jgi:hypothetical protein
LWAFLIVHCWLSNTTTRNGRYERDVPRMLRRSHKCHGLGRDVVRLRQDREIVSIRASFA